MMEQAMVWLSVAFFALAFAGLLFGFSSALAVIEGLLRAPKTGMRLAPVRVTSAARPEPRLWA